MHKANQGLVLELKRLCHTLFKSSTPINNHVRPSYSKPHLRIILPQFCSASAKIAFAVNIPREFKYLRRHPQKKTKLEKNSKKNCFSKIFFLKKWGKRSQKNKKIKTRDGPKQGNEGENAWRSPFLFPQFSCSSLLFRHVHTLLFSEKSPHLQLNRSCSRKGTGGK